MKRVIIVLAIVVVVAAGGYYVYHRYATAEAERVSQQETADQAQDLTTIIWASGELQPRIWAGLSAPTTGIVKAIHVSEGDWVQADDLLLELENGVLESEVERAAAQAAEAQAAVDKLMAGATDTEIASVQADLAAARAGVSQAAGQLAEADSAVKLAQASAITAQRQYDELASHPTPAEREAALAEESIADASVTQAQAAYNLVKGDPNISALPESMTLQAATAALEAAKAKARLAQEGATPEQLAVVQSQVDYAQVEVTLAQSRIVGAEAAVESAIAEQASAQASLDRLLEGATNEDIAMSRARAASAIAALGSAQAALEQSQIRAPMSGQIGTVNLRIGEMATPEQYTMLIGQTDDMFIKTTDLRETDVVNVRLDMPVEVTFDALPDRTFNGTVTKIAPMSNTEKGSTNYTVEIDVADLDESLRWGMTAFVNIDTNQ